MSKEDSSVDVGTGTAHQSSILSGWSAGRICDALVCSLGSQDKKVWRSLGGQKISPL